jgi:calcium permeable stress-gated cation channel
MDQPDYLETGGLYYPQALRAIFISLYVLELCMTGLFFLLTKPGGGRTTTGLVCGAIMAAMIVVTIGKSTWERKLPSYSNLRNSVPNLD